MSSPSRRQQADHSDACGAGLIEWSGQFAGFTQIKRYLPGAGAILPVEMGWYTAYKRR